MIYNGKRYREYLLFSAATFVLFFVIGSVIALSVDDPDILARYARGSFFPEDITFGALFLNNAIVVLSLAFGSVLFGVPTALVLIMSAFYIGVTYGFYAPDIGFETGLLLIIPHGLFEFTGLFLAAAIGFSLPHQFYCYLRGERDDIITRAELLESGYTLLVSLTLITIGAWVEAYITLDFVKFLGLL